MPGGDPGERLAPAPALAGSGPVMTPVPTGFPAGAPTPGTAQYLNGYDERCH